MVDVSGKRVTRREAIAQGWVSMRPATLNAMTQGLLPKGDVIAAAQLAGIQAAKRTAELIPLCHPLPLTLVEVTVAPDPPSRRVLITARVRADQRTGVEMEALTAVAISALTVYDMCKAQDPGMEIGGLCLLGKTGGKSGPWERKA
jgi:cyclic pyranopterin phosphate synthase